MTQISIVIPAYNAARYLSETLDSVLGQTFTAWELVVVDDGSTDATASIASAYASRERRIRVVSQVNGGVAAARNTGYSETSSASASVIFLDHDDVWHREALSVLWSALSAHPEAVAAHGMARKVDTHGQPIGPGKAALQNYERRTIVAGQIVTSPRCAPTTTEHILYDNWICTPGLALIRRSALVALEVHGQPLFDKEAVPLDDWDFWLRLSLLGELAFVDQALLDWRRHKSAGSLNVSAMSQAELRLREKMRAMLELDTEQGRIAENRYQRLLTTRHRRSAYELCQAAQKSLAGGHISMAFRQLCQALSNYVLYVQKRRRSERELWNVF